MTYHQDESLKYFTGISLAIHVLILAIIFTFTRYEASRDIEFIEVLPAVRVDVVAMPKMSLQELKNIRVHQTAEKSSAPNTNNAVDGTGPEYLKKTEKKSLFDLLKDQAKKKVGLKAKEGPPSKKSVVTGPDLSKLILEGNKISKGSAIVGSRSGQADGEVSQYVGALPDYVRPNWKLPSYLIDLDLNCRVRIFINSSGELIKAEVFKSSGNTEYDQRALNAIRMSRFPAPSGRAKELATDGKIILGFPL